MFKSFEEFLFESRATDDLHKVYITINPKYGHKWWTYKGFAGSNFFQQLTPDTYKDIDINPDYPVLNYNSDMVNTLLDEGLIKKQNIYNAPDQIVYSGSKAKFHEKVEGDPNIPETVFSKEEALEMSFPIIAKPAEGHSGIGIQIFKNPEDLKASKDKFDIFSEFVDKKEEHRFFLFNGQPFFWMERKALNDKAKSGSGETKDRMYFKYIKKDPLDLGEDYRELLTRFSEKFSGLPFICFDVMKSNTDKLYIIESNTMPGVPFDTTVKLYQNIFKDFFKRELSEQTKKELQSFSKFMINKTLEKDPKRFEIED